MDDQEKIPNTHTPLIETFCDITSSSRDEALFFLESHNFDLDHAVSTFLETNAATAGADVDLAAAAAASVPNRRNVSSDSLSPPASASPSSSASRLKIELQVRSLGGRLHAMEHRQGQMMHYLAQELQKPSFASSFMQQSEIHNRKRRLLISNCLYDEAIVGEKEKQILTFNMENTDSTAVPVLNLELIEKLDSSLNFWQNFLYQVGRTLWEEKHDCGVLVERTAVINTDINALSRHFAVNVQQCSPPPHPSSPDSRDVHLSTELAGSPSHVGSPALPSICLNIEVCPKSGIDVNSGPANVFDIDASAKRVEEKTTRVNDLFWEQFLTEAPGSSDIQEVQSRRRDADGGSNENKPADHHKYCWNVNNVDSLTKQMGHLTPAGRT